MRRRFSQTSRCIYKGREVEMAFVKINNLADAAKERKDGKDFEYEESRV